MQYRVRNYRTVQDIGQDIAWENSGVATTEATEVTASVKVSAL